MSDDTLYLGPPPDDRVQGFHSYEQTPYQAHSTIHSRSSYPPDNDMMSETLSPAELHPMPPIPSDTAQLFRATGLMRMIERYMPEADVRKVYEAFLVAADAHSGIMRKDNITPYIMHPLEVAYSLAESHLDRDTLCAALLHDVLEDSKKYSETDLTARFGLPVTEMVQGVTKLEKSETLASKQAVTQASLRKMMHAMADDYRVGLIKIADRLHNMQTLDNMSAEAKRRISKETFAIYIKLSHKLGMNEVRRKLQWLAFQHLYPWRSAVIERALNQYLTDHSERQRAIVANVEKKLERISGCMVFLWNKNLYRLYEKARTGEVNLRKQLGLMEIRVVVKNREDCYQALGLIHELHKPRMGTFKDFIATPKSYGFEALQTVVMVAGQRQQVKFQIQTREMYNLSLYGITARWRCPDMSSTKRMEYTKEAVQTWLAQVRDLDFQAEDSTEFYADIQADMSRNDIIAYTPAGDMKEFPRGATLVDFAYAVHTEIGNHCVRAKVDGMERQLRTRIPNMATIEIITDSHATPQAAWQNFVVTAQAKSSIRNWLRKQTVDDFIGLGHERLEIVLNSRGHSIDALEQGLLENTGKTLGHSNLPSLFAAIGRGDECAKLLTERLLGKMPAQEAKSDTPLLIKGTTGLAVKFAACCLPLPHEHILAHQLRGQQGLEVHRADCPNIAHLEVASTNQIFAVAWAKDLQGQKFSTGIVIDVRDVKGMLHHITKCMDDMDVNIVDLNITGEGQIKRDTLIIQVRDITHLQQVMRQLKHIPNVEDVTRLLKKDSHDQDDHFND